MSVVISQNLALSLQSSEELSLNNARIGYQSYLDDAILTTLLPSQDGYPIENIKTGQTFEVFKSTVSAEIISIDLGVAQDIDYIGMVGKNIQTYGLEYSLDGINYTQISLGSLTDNIAIMGLFESTTARYWRILVGTGTTDTINIANVKLGQVLAMYRPIYGGHSPITLSRKTTYKPNMSEGGEFLGRTITRYGYTGSYNWQHLPATWYREAFDPFVKHARTGTYYIAWRPETFPQEVAYGWTNEDIIPSNMGIRDLMQVSLNVEGYDAN